MSMNVKKEPKVFIVETGEEIVRISEDVLATVAGLAAAEVEGVAGLNGNVAESLLSLMGRKNPAAGVSTPASSLVTMKST